MEDVANREGNYRVWKRTFRALQYGESELEISSIRRSLPDFKLYIKVVPLTL